MSLSMRMKFVSSCDNSSISLRAMLGCSLPGCSSRSKTRQVLALGRALTKWLYLNQSVVVLFRHNLISAGRKQAADASGQNSGS